MHRLGRAMNTRILLAGVATIGIVGVAALWVFSGSEDGEGIAAFGDVHGLSVNPERGNEIYVATHAGLVVGRNDEKWSLVGPASEHFAAFAAHPTDGDVFFASGRGSLPTGERGNLGIVKSDDAGRSWRALAKEGSNFQALAVGIADSRVIWGFADDTLHKSENGGTTWSPVPSNLTGLKGLGGDPVSGQGLYAATAEGVLYSRNGGRAWETLRAGDASAVAVDPNKGWVYAVSDGRLHKSLDAGRTWNDLRLEARGTLAHLAIDTNDPRVVYAATSEGSIYKTTDDGKTWRTVREA